MITDFNILGIPETNDITIIKKAFHARAKELHPDVTDDRSKINNYYLFIEVCNAYDRLINNIKINTCINSSDVKTLVNTNEINKYNDPSYAYYKTACKYYELVHPSHWNNTHTITINGKTEEENKLQKMTF